MSFRAAFSSSDPVLFPHAEAGEDAGRDILPDGPAGQLAQSFQGLLCVGEKGVGGHAQGEGILGPGHAVQGPLGGLGLALVGEQRFARALGGGPGQAFRQLGQGRFQLV